ncbi:MAG: Uma2 family endonuclease [Acidobacteria bacterium]|nr:Uma2 family endonuclease [Acidobacteriota bacterium]MCI0624051.1 Uma2 family endonuclease [Acidobacteriota bacterium]
MRTDSVLQNDRVLPSGKLTFEEFLGLCDEDVWAEWVGGEVTMVSPASVSHQSIGSLLEVVLRIFVERHELGLVLRAPFLMRLAEIPSGREPDLLFVRKARLNLLQANYLDGPADLVVEIISPESIGRDRGEKFVEYERAGILEYWLIDPDRQSAEFYQLSSEGRYRTVLPGSDGAYHATVVDGFWLKAEWLWKTPLPAALDLLRELKIV